MGGSVFIGIKKPDGPEYYAERWTNYVPWVLSDSSFYNYGNAAQEYVVAKPSSLFFKEHKKLTYSEYGVILIDFTNKTIYSRQGYCAVGELLVYSIDNGLRKRIQDLYENNHIKEITGVFPFDPLPVKETVEKIVNLHENIFCRLVLTFDDWRFDHRTEDPRTNPKIRKEIRTYLSSNSWSLK